VVEEEEGNFRNKKESEHGEMFNCCCVNKKALKKAAADNEGLKENLPKENSVKSPKKPEETSCKSPNRNDKSNSSDEENNLSRLSGLIISDGLVGEKRVREEKFCNPFGRALHN
jgi:hypothetical protein